LFHGKVGSIWLHWLVTGSNFNKSIKTIGAKGCGLSKEGMANLILWNNICWNQALLKQIQLYKQDGTVPWMADKNFSEIALAISLEAGKVTFTNKDTTYKILCQSRGLSGVCFCPHRC